MFIYEYRMQNILYRCQEFECLNRINEIVAYIVPLIRLSKNEIVINDFGVWMQLLLAPIFIENLHGFF